METAVRVVLAGLEVRPRPVQAAIRAWKALAAARRTVRAIALRRARERKSKRRVSTRARLSRAHVLLAESSLPSAKHRRDPSLVTSKLVVALNFSRDDH